MFVYIHTYRQICIGELNCGHKKYIHNLWSGLAFMSYPFPSPSEFCSQINMCIALSVGAPWMVLLCVLLHLLLNCVHRQKYISPWRVVS